MSIAIPDILQVEPFEQMRERFITEFFLPHATKEVGEEMAQMLTRGLRSPNESAALLLDAMVIFNQSETRNQNYKYLQNFSLTATDSQMIDLICSRLDIKRQVLEPADNSVFPPKPEKMESNESLLLRYSLAPYGLATTGTRTGYKFHAMTLGSRPRISVYQESENVLIQRFEFLPTDGMTRPKDAEARMLIPHTGNVGLRVLSPHGDGTADEDLLSSVFDYCSRPDIGQATDILTVESAEILSYSIEVEVWEENAPTKLVDREKLNSALNAYAQSQHRLGGEIQHSRIDQIAHNYNARKVVINQPSSDLSCDWYQAPFCIGVSTHVRSI
ncbi:baseplate J/gp47 family protein [Vibrio vulnificus]|uniref:baseplate J/gp47 family protein n=1 Tax=Vibrio vulnificus TaxID=672 RepID=UPI0019D4CEDA|nr:baseplate J/gp47 family protein [Vibrio vulnificus]MBN8090500.1 baseplate J/gp47 family protein [Vibrio vulnificus]MBN8119315.1 baseplate J/gp47 family protein [Vibrio vulnificus]